MMGCASLLPSTPVYSGLALVQSHGSILRFCSIGLKVGKLSLESCMQSCIDS